MGIGARLPFVSRHRIKQLIETRITQDGTAETGVKGVQLFRVSQPLRCSPAVYEPTIVVIVSGEKEAIVGGERHVYDKTRYLCCTMSMPVEAGTPHASPENPLLGLTITLETRVLRELALEMQNASRPNRKEQGGALPASLALSSWDDDFTASVLRLLELGGSPEDTAVLGAGRLREVYYAMLKGEAARRAFGVGNEIARAIEYFSSHLADSISIDELAGEVGMSRAVLHRKFKQATTMSPIQFVKSMRLNQAAMRIAGGVNVNEAAAEVGYVSSSQFSREFKRMYGQAPKQWSHSKWLPD